MKIYIARDKDGTLFGYFGKPIKQGDKWRLNYDADNTCTLFAIPCVFYPFLENVKWEDEEPIEIELTK